MTENQLIVIKKVQIGILAHFESNVGGSVLWCASMLPDRASTIVNLQQLVSDKRTTWLLQIGFFIGCYEGENLGNGMAAMKSASIKGGYYCNPSRFVRRPLAISQWHDGAEWWSALKVLISAFHCQWCGWNRKWHESGLGSSWLIFSFVTWFSLSLSLFLSLHFSLSQYIG